jgi:hypothetical protein
LDGAKTLGYNQRLRALQGVLVHLLFNPKLRCASIALGLKRAITPIAPIFNNAAFNASKEPSWLFNKIKSHLPSVACIVHTMH